MSRRPPSPRGQLRVYLGAAPGVGKTYAMLDEGYRRRSRGTDVVVGCVDTHDRPATASQLRDLEMVPLADGIEPEMDLAAILARNPRVVLIDDLAHANAPGSAHPKRWQDVVEILDAGINVITTVDIAHLESLSDVVAGITGLPVRDTVPDALVRSADQVELIDMSPESLRRRMAHGNIYPPERIDAALANFFRLGNLGALRELALLWVADRVEDALDEYRMHHGIAAPWETRERIVVAVTGAPGTERLIRRAARIAGRARGDLIGVHVAPGRPGLGYEPPGDLAAHRDLLMELGGTYHEIAGQPVAGLLVEFAREQEATQIVLGASARSRLTELVRGSIIREIVRSASGIDVHVIAGTAPPGPRPLPHRTRPAAIALRRQLLGWAVMVMGLPGLTMLLVHQGSGFQLATALLLYLVIIVVGSAVGGVVPGVVGAAAGALLANWYLVPPVHTFTIADTEDLTTLVVFLAVAGTVSGYVNLAARRAQDARQARAEAEALARTTATLVGSADPLPPLLTQIREAFTIESVIVVRDTPTEDPTTSGIDVLMASGPIPEDFRGHRQVALSPSGDTRLLLVGEQFSADDERVLRAFADQIAVALAARQLQGELARASAIEQADTVRTALLRAVGHDLRTPLAAIKAAVTSLLSIEIDWDDDTRREFLETIDLGSDRLDRLVGNLLDMSRLEAGALSLATAPTAIDDVVAAALASLTSLPADLEVDVPPTLPDVEADPALLERAVANLVANAAAWSPPGRPIRVEAARVADRVHLRIVDRGPGIPLDQRLQARRPFQRLDDHNTHAGVGLGLAVAVGFVEAMHGVLELDDTPGGGLTVDISLPVHLRPSDPATSPGTTPSRQDAPR